MTQKYRLRSHAFFFSPRDYLNDPVVLAMNLTERGAYSTLLFALWDLDEPGVAPALDSVLATLARATLEEWVAVKHAVACAFDTESLPGFWIQKRMVREHRRQDRFYATKSRLGKLGADKRWGGKAITEPSLTYSDSPVTPVTPEKEKTHPPLSKDLTPASWTRAAEVARLVAEGVDSLDADRLLDQRDAARDRYDANGGAHPGPTPVGDSLSLVGKKPQPRRIST